MVFLNIKSLLRPLGAAEYSGKISCLSSRCLTVLPPFLYLPYHVHVQVMDLIVIKKGEVLATGESSPG